MKANYYRMPKENVLDMPNFCQKYPGPLGTHSTRKYGMTQCRQNGCHNDESNYCGTIYGDGITALLGKAVLWAMFDSTFMELVPQAWRHVLVSKYNNIPSHNCIADGENHVTKHCCVTWELEGIPHIDIINKDDAGNTHGVAGGRLLCSAEASAQMSAMHNRMHSLKKTG
eukprot:9515782-Ditylum_brightwellii.AAC.1